MDIYIDDEAKAKIDLTKITDTNGRPYYIGKLQFPGTLNFKYGVSFFVFLSENGIEELQISPLTLSRFEKAKTKNSYINRDKASIPLYSMVDQNKRTYYVGEAVKIASIDLRQGIFFTIFTSKPGFEELQISKLNPNRKKHTQQNNKKDSL